MKIFLISAGAVLLIASFIYRSKRAKNKVVSVIDENCTGCSRCIKKCRHKVLNIKEDEVGKLVVVEYPRKCTACGDCIIVCKFNALELVNRK